MSRDPIFSHLLADFAARRALRAGSFIVTIYGDAIGPRGGSVWMGNIVETCALVGISETLARTAVSRLVEAGRLTGSRAGRRSFYRLTPAAEVEFEAAARALHGPEHETPPDGWTLVALAPTARGAALDALAKRGFGAVGGGLAAKPGGAAPEARAALAAVGAESDALVFSGALEAGGTDALAAFAAAAWDLEALSADYEGFHRRFGPLADQLAAGARPAGDAALALRLLLVHDFRHIALRDPRLPKAASLAGWAGDAARMRFRHLYEALSPAMEAHVAERFVDVGGPLGAPSRWRRRAA